MSSKATINHKKYYRVILEGFDPQKANADSFALKLSMATRTSLPRARQVVHRLPSVIKRDLDVVQANKLKNNVEQCGGLVRMESYLVVVGDGGSRELVRRERDEAEVVLRVVCRACGTESSEGTEKCPECGERIAVVEAAETEMPVPTPPDLPDEEQPAENERASQALHDEPIVTEKGSTDILGALSRNKFLIAAGLLMILLLISIIKQ